jgi:hypothetical protein
MSALSDCLVPRLLPILVWAQAVASGQRISIGAEAVGVDQDRFHEGHGLRMFEDARDDMPTLVLAQPADSSDTYT